MWDSYIFNSSIVISFVCTHFNFLKIQYWVFISILAFTSGEKPNVKLKTLLCYLILLLSFKKVFRFITKFHWLLVKRTFELFLNWLTAESACILSIMVLLFFWRSFMDKGYGYRNDCYMISDIVKNDMAETLRRLREYCSKLSSQAEVAAERCLQVC